MCDNADKCRYYFGCNTNYTYTIVQYDITQISIDILLSYLTYLKKFVIIRL